MTLIVADAGPLIGLAVSGHLVILSGLFERVLVPPAVYDELQLDASRPGSRALAVSEREGWLVRAEVREPNDAVRLAEILDRGEAQAILLALSREVPLLIDERRGRAMARRHNVSVVGTGGLLVQAKRKGLIPEVKPVLEALDEHGYRLSLELQRRILNLAGEADGSDA